jgi:hypothetical protein
MKLTRRGSVNEVKRINGTPVLFVAFAKPGNAYDFYLFGCTEEQALDFGAGKSVVMTLEVETS